MTCIPIKINWLLGNKLFEKVPVNYLQPLALWQVFRIWTCLAIRWCFTCIQLEGTLLGWASTALQVRDFLMKVFLRDGLSVSTSWMDTTVTRFNSHRHFLLGLHYLSCVFWKDSWSRISSRNCWSVWAIHDNESEKVNRNFKFPVSTHLELHG